MRNQDEHTPAPLSREQRYALLERILASVQFTKSPKLSSFLSYICEQDRMGHAHLINEQRIGVAVFGRPEGYNVGDDSIVRSQARFLRQRLEEYFAKEGSDESIELRIPKGSYLPIFEPRVLSPEPPPEPVQVAPAAPPLPEAARTHRFFPAITVWQRFALALLGTVLALGIFYIFHNRPNEILKARESTNQRFWNTIFDPKRTPIIVPSDSSLVLVQEINNRAVPLSDYMNRKYMSDSPGGSIDRVWRMVANSQYTSLADLNLVSRLAQQPGAASAQARIRYARDLALKELKENNAILIGGKRSNPWVELYSPLMHMNVDYDQQAHKNFVWNHNPGKGEQERYFEVADSEGLHTAYGVIAYLPSLDGQGTALLVGGTSKAGTEAAAEFLFSSGFSALLGRFEDQNPLPHFEILISSENINGESHDGKLVCFHLLNSGQ
jgi:hypothetical protein